MIAFIKRKEFFFICLVAVLITGIFFYKTILHGQIPFPGDLLASESPYKVMSFSGYPPGGYPNISQGVDVITEMFPWKYFVIQQLKKGQIPFWDPYNFSGNMLMQNYQSAVFYPFNAVFFIFSFSSAWSVFIMLQPVLAILFMYVFLRSLKLNFLSALIGSVAFGFSSYMTVWMEYGNIGSTFLWLPLSLFALQKFITSPRVSWLLLVVGSLFLSFLAGYIQGVFYIYIVAIVFVSYRCFPQRKIYSLSFWLSLCVMLMMPICFSLFQLLPTYDSFRASTRGAYSLQQIGTLLQPVYYWVTIFVPDFFGNPAHNNYFLTITYIERVMYIGVPLLFFSFLSIAKVKSHDMRFFLFMGIATLILVTNFPLVKYFYLLPIPMISTTVPTRALSIFIFCMIIVGSYGIDYWIRQETKEKTIVPFVFLGIYVLIWLAALVLPKFLPIIALNKSVVLHNLFLPTGIAVATVGTFYLRRQKLFKQVSLLLLFVFVIVDLFSFFQRITPFAPKQLMYPQTPVVTYLQKHAGINRAWGYGPAYILPNFQTEDGTYSPEGNDPLHIKAYGLLLASSGNGSYPDLLPRPDANIANTYGVNTMRNPYRQKILNLLGVKYIIFQNDSASDQMKDRYDMFQPENYKLVWQDTSSWQIYQNTTSLSRFFLTSNYILSNSEKDTLAKIYTTDVSKTLILSKKPTENLDTHATGNVSLISYTPNKVIFQTNTTGNMMLFLSDNFFHSWIGKIDTKMKPIYTADLTFRAIEVSKGKHLVTFSYYPQTFSYGLIIAACSFVFFVIYAVYFYLYVQKK